MKGPFGKKKDEEDFDRRTFHYFDLTSTSLVPRIRNDFPSSYSFSTFPTVPLPRSPPRPSISFIRVSHSLYVYHSFGYAHPFSLFARPFYLFTLDLTRPRASRVLLSPSQCLLSPPSTLFFPGPSFLVFVRRLVLESFLPTFVEHRGLKVMSSPPESRR